MRMRPAYLPVGLFALSLAISVLAGLAFFLPTAARPARADQPDPGSVVRAFFDAQNAGDTNGALAYFAENAIFTPAGPATLPCTQRVPCTDLAGIQRQIQFNVMIHDCKTVRFMTVAGAVVTGQMEGRNDSARGRGIERVIQDFVALVQQGKIVFFANLNDLADPQTALNAAIAAGTASAGTPIPNPTAACGPS